MNFGEILRKELKKQGKTQRWLANELGVTPAAVTKYLNGNPSWDVITKINSVLPLPEAAALLQTGERLSKYVGNENTNPEILARLEYLTLAYSDVLEDPEARAEFAELVQAISQLTPEQRRGLLLLLQTFDMRTK